MGVELPIRESHLGRPWSREWQRDGTDVRPEAGAPTCTGEPRWRWKEPPEKQQGNVRGGEYLKREEEKGTETDSAGLRQHRERWTSRWEVRVSGEGRRWGGAGRAEEGTTRWWGMEMGSPPRFMVSHSRGVRASEWQTPGYSPLCLPSSHRRLAQGYKAGS